MTQYIKIMLQPGQQKRSDISDWRLASGELIWIGDDLTVFDPTAPTGAVGPNDPPVAQNYFYAPCDQADLDELAAQNFNLRKEGRERLLMQAVIDLFGGLLEVFKVGRDKNLWVATDFDAEIRAKFIEWIALIDEHKADSPDVPTI